MTFSIGGFLIGRVVAQNEGITDDSVLNRLSLFGGLLGTTATGLVMTTVIARREAEDIAPVPTPIPLPGTPQVQVPDVTNKPIAEAKDKLVALGLQVQEQPVISGSTAFNTVIAQVPEAKSLVAPGAVVTLLVSTRSTSSETVMPNLIALSQGDAQAQLTKLGLDLSITAFTVGSSATKGTVIEQTPDPGEPIELGDKVTLLISTGILTDIELVRVPNVVGKSFEEAKNTLVPNFEVKGDTVQNAPDGTRPGVILEQSPLPDTQVEKGTQVLLKVFRPVPGPK